jgi:MerR family transcriptional regulator, copper efflux regulator
MMRIGDLAQQTGLKPSAIRFYEASGLMPAGQRGPNGYRLYTDTALARLRLIQLGQRLGLSLDTMRKLLQHPSGTLPHDALLASLRQRRAEIAALRHALNDQESELLRWEAECQAHWEQGRCIDLNAHARARKPTPDAGAA